MASKNNLTTLSILIFFAGVGAMTWYNCLWRMNNRTDINDVSIQIHYYLDFAIRSYAGILND